MIFRVVRMNNENETEHQDILAEQRTHFEQLYEENRGTPNAVASETYEHKKLRYDKIVNIFPDNGDFSIYEVGYGLGHFYEYMRNNLNMDRVTYSGSEIVKKYHNYCTETYKLSGEFELRNIIEDPPSGQFDYVIMSGVFHQMGDTPKEAWEEYMYDLLKKSYELSTRGIAFNSLSQVVDYEKEGNYYSNISDLIEFINKDLSRFFELKKDYPLFERTIFVYRPEYIANEHPEKEFQKYL